MLTRCPYYDCKHCFDRESAQPVDLMRPERGICPSCSRPASFRSLEIIERCDRIENRLSARPIDQSEPVEPPPPPSGLSALLEDVRSLFNVGSMFRTADAASVSTMFLCGITGNPPRKEIAKTSLGSEDWIDWRYAAGVGGIVPNLKKQGVLIVGLEKTAQSQDLTDLVGQDSLKTPLCLLVGNEVTGLSDESLHLCDLVCHLPMTGKKESLNVAVAFGIAAYMIRLRSSSACLML